MDTAPALRLTQAGAERIMAAALAKARELGRAMSVAIVDEGGHLLLFTRMEQGKAHTVSIAQAKARAAASNRMPTGKVGSTGHPLDDAAALALTLAAGPERFTMLPGGLPILVEGHCVGGIGVSGGTGTEDVEVAQAGLAPLGGAPRA